MITKIINKKTAIYQNWRSKKKHLNQYLKYPSRAFLQAAHLFSFDLTRLLHISVGTLLQMVSISCFRVFMDLIRTLTNSLSIQVQIDLIEFKSEDRAHRGQDNKSTLFSFVHALTKENFDVFHGFR